MVKLRILQTYRYGMFWECYNPKSTSTLIAIVGTGETPEQAYNNYLHPLQLCGVSLEGSRLTRELYYDRF